MLHHPIVWLWNNSAVDMTFIQRKLYMYVSWDSWK